MTAAIARSDFLAIWMKDSRIGGEDCPEGHRAVNGSPTAGDALTEQINLCSCLSPSLAAIWALRSGTAACDLAI